ncbi:response regulator [Vulgatibacter incomptus]|uniref:Response regulatory domain-containing protein n=1 Tax=Vulgatibacter incomptus TaxID=1391653 RepID=A0A0K1PCK3_9BACT|nr:response regulator [Vulgatibacter incomptus]AKU91227.1 hypothetical protein AKJ08_1614 [Vulgatibacter incomptus]
MPRVLLIDDDTEFLDVLSEWLTGRGHEVSTLSDGTAVLTALDEFQPDLVVLDGLLRGTSGSTVAQEIETQRQLRIIYVSGLPRDEFPADRPVFQKPIDLDVLDRFIREEVRAAADGT